MISQSSAIIQSVWKIAPGYCGTAKISYSTANAKANKLTPIFNKGFAIIPANIKMFYINLKYTLHGDAFTIGKEEIAVTWSN